MGISNANISIVYLFIKSVWQATRKVSSAGSDDGVLLACWLKLTLWTLRLSSHVVFWIFLHRASREVKQPINRLSIYLVGYISKNKPLPLLRVRRFVPCTTILLDLHPFLPRLIMVSIQRHRNWDCYKNPTKSPKLERSLVQTQLTSDHESVVKVISWWPNSSMSLLKWK